MASLNTELALVKRFHMLSGNYDNRPVVARRNTLPVLVRFLGSNDRETRYHSLMSLHLLAQHPDNIELLCGERRLVKEVFKLYKEAECDDPELHDLANQILDCLEPVLQNRDPRNETALAVNAIGSSGSNNLDDSVLNDSESLAHRARSSRILHGSGSDAVHTVVLDIPALDPHNVDDLAAIEDVFQTTRGVLSYSIFLENRQVRLFLTCETHSVQKVLSDMGFESVVIRDDVVGQDVFNHANGGLANSSRSYYASGTSQQRPSYIESFTNSLYKTALVLRGGRSDDNTLSARVQKQRAREQEGGSTLAYVKKTLSRWW